MRKFPCVSPGLTGLGVNKSSDLKNWQCQNGVWWGHLSSGDQHLLLFAKLCSVLDGQDISEIFSTVSKRDQCKDITAAWLVLKTLNSHLILYSFDSLKKERST